MFLWLLQEQRSHLGKFLRTKMGLPSFVGQLLGLITPILDLQRKSDAANEVRGFSWASPPLMWKHEM